MSDSWISTTELMPEPNCWCLVCFDCVDVYVAFFYEGEFFPQSQHILTFNGFDVEKINSARFSYQPTHWMPLPLPPINEKLEGKR